MEVSMDRNASTLSDFTGRFEYASRKTYDAARDYLEDLFACGLVCEGEFPDIEHHPRRQVGRQYVITLQYAYSINKGVAP
jgi:hypothetical protein